MDVKVVINSNPNKSEAAKRMYDYTNNEDATLFVGVADKPLALGVLWYTLLKKITRSLLLSLN